MAAEFTMLANSQCSGGLAFAMPSSQRQQNTDIARKPDAGRFFRAKSEKIAV
jgi:hypothetical protein